VSYVLGPLSTTDDWQGLLCPGAVKVSFQVTGARVFVSFGAGWPAATYGPDEPIGPATGSLLRRCDALRVRSLTPGVPARVDFVATPAGEAT